MPRIQTENAQNFFRSAPKRINVGKLNEALSSGDGTNIGYLSFEGEGHPGIGMRISKGRLVDKSSIDFWAKQPDYLAGYFETAFLKPGLLRTLVSEVLSSGIHEKLENGVTIQTPDLFGHALVNRKSGEVVLFPYPPEADSDKKLDVVKKMLIEQAQKLKVEDGWEHASVVSDIDGLGDKTRFRPAADYFDSTSDGKDYIAGLDGFQSSSDLVIALRKKGLACVDPGSNPPLYNPASKTCVLADIGSFGCTDHNVQLSALKFIRGLEKESGMKSNKPLNDILNNQDIFVERGSTHSQWEQLLRSDEIKKNMKYVSEVPAIRFWGLDKVKEYWEKIRDEPYDHSKSAERIEQGKKFLPYGGRQGIDILIISLENASRRIERGMGEMMKSAGRDSFLVNMGREGAQKGLAEMTEIHSKLKQLFSDVFNIK